MKRNILALFAFLLLVSCNKYITPSNKSLLKNYTSYVNTFIGTGGHGHTYPGASMPFGMIQLSPDTRLEGWDGCGGYHYTDSIVYGFSHTHLSGTGVPDYGDVLLMPTTGDITWDNGYKSGAEYGYASYFSHDKEKASPGNYSVHLDDYDIDVELTVTPRCGIHQYTFNGEHQANVILDLLHRDMLLDADIEIIDNTSFRGKRISKAWAEEQHVYFYGVFSKPFSKSEIKKSEIIALNNAKTSTQAAFSFESKKGEKILLKIGISAVSMDGAKNNLLSEINHWDFDRIKAEATNSWNKALAKIDIKEEDIDKKTIFYTALYHSMLKPNLYMDVDGNYRGTDLEIHQAIGYTNYTLFSLWDTHRATHPLFTILERQKTKDFIKTFLNQYKYGGQLPVWELSGNYTGCMIGYHGVSVIADAYAKGIHDFDTTLALEAMEHSANEDKLGLDALKEYGFISAGEEPESVSKTLEYAYDDWCIGLFAQATGNKSAYHTFQQRAQYYKNIYDPTEGFMRAKINNTWFKPFDPAEVNFNYTEANSWQYSFAAPQDIKGLINIYGGNEKFESKLDKLFETDMQLSGRHQVDITGLIGQYAHGNEPSHHIAYLYDYIGKPWKTQNRIQEILYTMYQNQPDGLSGNEDCGQMSSWYVLSAMGFYPVTPGLAYYAIGTPILEEATIHLENNNTFRINANNLSFNKKYIQSATLNGEIWNKAYINHSDIMKGGNLIFEMGDVPNEAWGLDMKIPSINENLITSVPFIAADSQTFSDSMIVSMGTVDNKSKIYYTLDGSEPNLKSIRYNKPLSLTKTTHIKAIAYRADVASFLISSNFYKIDDKRSIQLLSAYANQYAAGGENALIDFINGGDNYRTGTWQGYEGQDIVVIIDLGEVKNVENVSMGFFQDIKSWIWFPSQVKFEVAVDKESFSEVSTIKNDSPIDEYGSSTQKVECNVGEQIRYIKITATNRGKCPDWHLGAGGDSWIFTDEIEVK